MRKIVAGAAALAALALAGVGATAAQEKKPEPVTARASLVGDGYSCSVLNGDYFCCTTIGSTTTCGGTNP